MDIYIYIYIYYIYILEQKKKIHPMDSTITLVIS